MAVREVLLFGSGEGVLCGGSQRVVGGAGHVCALH